MSKLEAARLADQAEVVADLLDRVRELEMDVEVAQEEGESATVMVLVDDVREVRAVLARERQVLELLRSA